MGSEKPQSVPSIWSANYIALIVVSLFYNMGQVSVTTILPLYSYELGISATIIGTIVGIFAASALCIRPFAGPAFDSFSKRKLLVAIYAIALVCTLLYSHAYTVPQLIAIRLFHGLAIGTANALMMAMASEMLPVERMSSGIAIFTLAQAVSQTIAPAIAIELSRHIGYSLTFIVAAGGMAAAVLGALFVIKDPYVGERLPYQIKLDRIIAKNALIPAVILLFFAMAYQNTSSFVAIYGGLRGVDQIGLYFAAYAGCMLVSRPVFGHLSDKFGVDRVLIPSMLCFAFSFVLLYFSKSLPMFLLAGAAAAFGYGGALPLVQTLVFKCVPVEARGSGSNTSYIGMDIGAVTGPILGGWIIESMRGSGCAEAAAYSYMWLVMVIPVLLALVFLISQRKRLARYEAENKIPD